MKKSRTGWLLILVSVALVGAFLIRYAIDGYGYEKVIDPAGSIDSQGQTQGPDDSLAAVLNGPPDRNEPCV